MDLSNLLRLQGHKKKSKRIGRGYGSGKGGHTVGLGTKGQKARGSAKNILGFEGGQMPLYKRMPQIGGFRNPRSKTIISVNIRDLLKFDEKTEVTPEILLKEGIIKKMPSQGVKILSNGKIKNKITLKGFLYSKEAKEKLEKFGCKIIEG